MSEGFSDIGHLPAEMQAAITYMAESEELKGRGGGIFDPDAKVTRAEAATMQYRAAMWPALAAEHFKARTVHFMYFTSGGAVGVGAGWWAAPRMVRTGRHVITEAGSDPNRLYCRDFGICLRGIGGIVRGDVLKDPSVKVITELDILKDPTDLAMIVVPEELWERYLDQRVAMGLPREQEYLKLPPVDDVPIVGEPVAAIGSPLMYENIIHVGIVSGYPVYRQGYAGMDVAWAMNQAAINPGNSGGPLISRNRKLRGMNLLKPWYNSGSWGMTHGDDMGLTLTPNEIRAWDRRQNLHLLGIQL